MKLNLGHFVRYWVPAIAWMMVIFAASTDLMSAQHTSRFIGPLLRWLLPDITAAGIAAVQFFVRKGAHLTEYAILGALLWRAFRYGLPNGRRLTILLPLVIAFACAALDEFHQSFIASRTGSPLDVMIDTAGALIGLAICAWVAQRRVSDCATSRTC